MNVNLTMMRLVPQLKKAEALLQTHDFVTAEEHISDYVGRCAQCYEENPTRDGRRVAAVGYTRGATFYSKMFVLETDDAYTFPRHQIARLWADEGIRLAYATLCDDRDSGRSIGNAALEFVAAVTAGLLLGKSPCVVDHMRHSDVLIEKLLRANPENKEMQVISSNYNEAKQSSDDAERIFQSNKNSRN